jgi:hypothetical protein
LCSELNAQTYKKNFKSNSNYPTLTQYPRVLINFFALALRIKPEATKVIRFSFLVGHIMTSLDAIHTVFCDAVLIFQESRRTHVMKKFRCALAATASPRESILLLCGTAGRCFVSVRRQNAYGTACQITNTVCGAWSMTLWALTDYNI